MFKKNVGLQVLVLFVLLVNLPAFAQDKVSWSFNHNSIQGRLEFSAHIEPGWHLYSQHIANDIGPVPTSFAFNQNNDITLNGAVQEPAPIQKYNETFEATLDFFEHDVLFQQSLTVKKSTQISGTITYMVCNDFMCLPPTDVPFVIQINKN